MKLILPLLAFLSFILTCVAADRQPQIDDIREATFRFLFRKNASSLKGKAQVYFLAFGELAQTQSHDPDNAFIKRFAGNKPRVAKRSESNESPEGVKDKTTGEIGLVFNVGDIRWISDEEVEVSGGYFEAGLSASGSTYQLRKIKGKWTVRSEEMHWISRARLRPHQFHLGITGIPTVKCS
jgi:hypothetical protein